MTLNARHVSHFKKSIDVVNVDLPKLEDVDDGRVVVGEMPLAAGEDEREPIIIGKDFVKCTMNGRAPNIILI